MMRIFKITLFILVLLVSGLLVLQCRSTGGADSVPDVDSDFTTNPVQQTLTAGAGEVAPVIPDPLPGSSVVNHAASNHVQAVDRVITLKDIPEGEFRRQVEKLPRDIQAQVFKKIEKSPQLLNDIESIRVDSGGMIFYVCKLERKGAVEGAEAAPAKETFLDPPVFDGPVPNSSPPAFHSRPGSSRVLFIDFNGHDISGTAWNREKGVATWHCRSYDKDGNTSQFSVAEQQTIYETWLRVSEDYAPFDVDVTTELPAVWNQYTGHALVTGTTDMNGVACPHHGYGGIAYLDVFGDSNYSYNGRNCHSPVWVFDYSNADDISEVISHELGHNMGLHHDGANWDDDAYYDGHQNGSVSWAAIMGTAYGHDVTQWSKGDYYEATESEDDLAVISSKLTYVPDDHGDSAWSATPLTLDGSGAVSEAGIIQWTDDPDVFALSVSSALAVSATVRVAQQESGSWGGNLDVLFEIRDSLGNVIMTNNEALVLSAQIDIELLPGTYFLHIKPTGVGDPFSSTPTGYTSYGSLGQYELQISSLPLNDFDRDGLPNEWEQQYFGGITNANPDAVASNGVNTVMEAYIAGLNPTNSRSLFEAAFTNADGFIVQWNATSGRVYSVLGSTNLAESFQPLETNILWPQASWTDNVPRVESFYRINVQLQ